MAGFALSARLSLEGTSGRWNCVTCPIREGVKRLHGCKHICAGDPPKEEVRESCSRMAGFAPSVRLPVEGAEEDNLV